MQFVQKSAPSTISCVFDVDGVPTELDSPPEVTITASDGTSIVTATSAKAAEGDQYDYRLAGQPALDVLKAVWTGELGGDPISVTTYVEVIGSVLFTVAQAKKRKAFQQRNRFTPLDIRIAHDLALEALQDACGVAFVQRRRAAALDGSGTTELVLPTPLTQSVTGISIEGTALDIDDLAAVKVYDAGILRRPTVWPRGYQNVEVDYVHGHRVPPQRIARAALLLAEHWLIESAIPDRATSLSTEDGTMQFLVTAGVRGAQFDIPEVNAAVQEYSWSEPSVG